MPSNVWPLFVITEYKAIEPLCSVAKDPSGSDPSGSAQLLKKRLEVLLRQVGCQCNFWVEDFGTH